MTSNIYFILKLTVKQKIILLKYIEVKSHIFMVSFGHYILSAVTVIIFVYERESNLNKIDIY